MPASEDLSAPTHHVLRPHHLVLLSILMIAFKENEIKRLNPEFQLHIIRILLREVSETVRPTSHAKILQEIKRGVGSDAPESAQFMGAVLSIHTDIWNTEKIGNFLGNLPCLFVDKIGAMPDLPRFTKKSLFGFFVRRCFVSYIKLSYAGLSELRADYQAWCHDQPVLSYQIPVGGDLSIDHQVHKTAADKKLWAQGSYYGFFEGAQAVGDEHLAVEYVRKFFEQQFNENTDSGFRQHALLNLAQWHYVNKEYLAARKLLGEAITTSRTANDRPTLLQCLSLLHRLPPASGSKPSINEIQPDMDPLEVLFDVKKLMDEENGQPLSAAFNKIIEAMGLYDHTLDVRRDRSSAIPSMDYQMAQHAVQSIVWQEAGCHRLADIHENIVIAFTDIGSENSTRLTMLLNKTYRWARQGEYFKALAVLVDPSTWRGLAMADYRLWAHEVWAILALRAVRRGQQRLYSDYLIHRRPPGEFSQRYYQFEQPLVTRLPVIRQTIYNILQLKQNYQLSTAVNDVLKLLWHSEFQGRYNLYRTGIVLMADFGLEYGMAKKSKRLLKEIMPQIILGDDLELRAVVCYTYARAIIAADDSDETTFEVMKEATTYLKYTRNDFLKLQMFPSMKESTALEAILFDNMGLTDEKEEAVQMNKHATTEMTKYANVAGDLEVIYLCNLITKVGTALTSRPIKHVT